MFMQVADIGLLIPRAPDINRHTFLKIVCSLLNYY